MACLNNPKPKAAGCRPFFPAALIVVLAGGCGRFAPPAQAPPPTPAGGWNWLDFPRAERIELAQAFALIEPCHVELLKAPREGWFELDAKLKGVKDMEEPLAAGQPIGRMAPGSESFEPEGEALRAQLAVVEEQLRKVREEEAVESFLEQERKARQDIKTYEAALALAADPALRRDLLPQAELASREEIKRLEDRLQAAKERLEKNRAAGEKQAELQNRVAELTEAKADFERRQKTERDQLKAPFAGQLRFAVAFETKAADNPPPSVPPPASAPAKAGDAPAPLRRAYVRADALLGILRDNSAFWAKVEVADASLLSVPARELLFAFVSGPQTVEASFGGRAPDAAGRPAPVYQFGIDTPTPDIVRLAGGQVSGKLVQKLPQAAYIVPKIRLQIHRSEAFADGAWEKDCARVFPGCRVLAVGRDAVALVPPQEGAAPDAGAAAEEGK